MKNDKILETFITKRGTHVEELPNIETVSPSEDLKYFNNKLARSLKDIKIGETLAPLDVDPKNTVGKVIEPDKEIEWKDLKDKT